MQLVSVESTELKLPTLTLVLRLFLDLTEHLVAIKDGLALLLDLLLPTLLRALHSLQHRVPSVLGSVSSRTHLLRVLFIVQWLYVRVLFADEWIHQQQEQHVKQQCTQNGKVDDDRHLDGVAASFLILALTQQTVGLHIMTRNRHRVHYMQAVTILLRDISVVHIAGYVSIWRADTLAANILKVLSLGNKHFIKETQDYDERYSSA